MSTIEWPTLEQQLSLDDCHGQNPELSVEQVAETLFIAKVRCAVCNRTESEARYLPSLAISAVICTWNELPF